MDSKALRDLWSCLQHDSVVAIGEFGLDFHKKRMQDKDIPPKETQIKWFRSQLNMAKRLRLAMVLHVRDADNEALDIMKDVSIL